MCEWDKEQYSKEDLLKWLLEDEEIEKEDLLYKEMLKNETEKERKFRTEMEDAEAKEFGDRLIKEWSSDLGMSDSDFWDSFND